MEVVNAIQEWKPTRWQRIKWWQRWPWIPRRVDDREWGGQPWAVEVREANVCIGWTGVNKPETDTVIDIGRWSALRALVTGLRFEIRVYSRG